MARLFSEKIIECYKWHKFGLPKKEQEERANFARSLYDTYDESKIISALFSHYSYLLYTKKEHSAAQTINENPNTFFSGSSKGSKDKEEIESEIEQSSGSWCTLS